MNNTEIGNRIKTRRKELKLTLQEVANMVGVASSTIQRYENGTISQYKLPILESIAKAINVNPKWLLKEDATMETYIPDNIFLQENKLITKSIENIKSTINLRNYISCSERILTKEENILLDNFNKLNNYGKKEATKRVSELTEISKYTTRIDRDEKYTLAAHDDGLNKETAKRNLEIAKAIFEQMDNE